MKPNFLGTSPSQYHFINHKFNMD